MDYDIIIIGAGAGGGTLAYALASTGKRILLIDRGNYLPREKENWDADEIFLRGRYQAPEQWLDAQTACVDPAVQHDNVTLLTNTRVTRLLTVADGRRVNRVEIETDTGLSTLSAEVVVAACGAINSAALLLKSANGQHPNGLANSSGQVGRNLMKHNHSALIAIAPETNRTVFQKTLGIHDYYFGGPFQDYPLGQIQLTGKAKWQRLAQMAPTELSKTWLEYLAEHSVDWWVTTEDLPRPENRVSLTAAGQIQVHFTPNNLKPHMELISLLEQHLKELGFYLFWHKRMDLSVFWHQVGTCRFGADPQVNVLDVNCRAHDVENLYVVDASFLPSMGAMNPTLTIIANALRVAGHLKSVL